MLIIPRPGVNRENLLDLLRSIHSRVLNLRSGGPPGSTAYGWLLAYLDWSSEAARMLGNQISPADLDRLVLTRGYERLLSGLGSWDGMTTVLQRAVNGLVSTEMEQRVTTFEEVIKTIEEQIQRWALVGDFLVPDTSFFIKHPDKLEEVDFKALPLDIPGTRVHVLVPIVVVDELDRLKESKDRDVRWRAGYTTAVLDRVLQHPTGPARLHEEDASAVDEKGIPLHGEITIELLFDPPGHVHLPIADDEVIARTQAVVPLAARKVTLLTYDTGQSMRARAAGLPVVKLTKPIGEEPKQPK